MSASSHNPTRDAVVRCLVSSGQEAAAGLLSRCGSWYMSTCPECGIDIVPKQNRCRLRICPDCAAREARKRFGVLRSEVLHLNTHKRGKWRLLTLTMRNPPDGCRANRIGAQLRSCGQAMYKLWRNILSKAGPSAGAIAGFEVGPSGNVHVHVLHFGDFVSWAQVRKLWRRLTTAYVIKIQGIKGTARQTLMGALAECTKYLCDPTKTDARIVAAVNLATRRLRCYRTYGSLLALADKDFEAPRAQCPACFYEGPMNRGRALCVEEADAWFSSVPYVRKTGSRYPIDKLKHVLPGLFDWSSALELCV